MKDSPFLVTTTINHYLDHLVQTSPENIDFGIYSENTFMYMTLFSVWTAIIEAILVRKEITKILGRMTMKIRKWVSNRCDILDIIPS